MRPSATGTVGRSCRPTTRPRTCPGSRPRSSSRCPGATLLVVDDGSPDGTGDLADGLAATDPRVRVKHRPAKQGLGRAYLDGFGVALGGGASIVIQMDADWSHDPTALPSLIAPIDAGMADLVIGSRYTKGGGVEDWGIVRRIISRGGSMFARIVLGLKPHDLTGGFKAWRATTLAAVPFDGVRAGGYVFQIEMTYRASRLGARVVEVPITFRDRRVGPVEDEPPDRRRGAGRRHEPALGRAARPRAGRPRDVTGERPRRAGGRAPDTAPPGRGRARRACASSSTSARSRTRSGRR